MKQSALSILLTLIVFTVSACGAQPVPTINAADVQHTAEAAAFTMVAQTQAAIPSATPLPPTETPTQTPAVTDTPIASPTLIATQVVSAATTNPNVDPCDTRVLSAPEGRDTIIRIVNKTRVRITVSVYLNETAGQGACGWASLELAKNSDTVRSDWVQGCYNLWAWSDDPNGRFRSSGSGCINNPDKWTFEVSEGMIKFVGP